MSAQEKAPAFQFYVKDYTTDEAVMMMSLEQEGAFIRLLCHAWLHGSIPSIVAQLAVICRVPTAKMHRLWPGIAPCFQPGEAGRLVNSRLEKSRAILREYTEKQRLKGKASAEQRLNRGSTAVQPDTQPDTGVRLPIRFNSPSPSPSPSSTSTTETDNGALSISPSQESVTDYELEPCNSSKGKREPVPMEQRQEYAEAVRAAFAEKTSRPTYQFTAEDGYWLKRWMDAGIPLRLVLRELKATRGIGYKLAYYNSSVVTEHERVSLALSGTR